MKKLTVLVVIMLVAGLLAGCGIIPEWSVLQSIVIEPDGITFTTREPVSIEVTACYKDGDTAIVTLECDYKLTNEGVVTLDITKDEVIIAPVGIGETEVEVSYTERNFWTGTRTVEDVICIQVENPN